MNDGVRRHGFSGTDLLETRKEWSESYSSFTKPASADWTSYQGCSCLPYQHHDDRASQSLLTFSLLAERRTLFPQVEHELAFNQTGHYSATITRSDRSLVKKNLCKSAILIALFVNINCAEQLKRAPDKYTKDASYRLRLLPMTMWYCHGIGLFFLML